MLLLLTLLACEPEKIDLGGTDVGGDNGADNGGETGETAPPPPPPPTLELTGGHVLDPMLAPTLLLALTEYQEDQVVAAPDETVRVEVLDAKGTPLRTLADGSAWTGTVTWDGRDTKGLVVPLGGYTIRATLLDGKAEVDQVESPAWVVRVGITDGTFVGKDRIPLCWYDAGGSYFDGGADTPSFTLPGLDDGKAPFTVPEVWADLEHPPMDLAEANLPVAWPAAATPSLVLGTGGEWGDAPISARIAGWTLADEAPAPGEDLVFTLDGPLSETVGVVEGTLSLEWVEGETVFATQAIPYRIYATMGPPAFEGEGLPYQPWVAVIDPLLRTIDGTEPALQPVVSGVVDYVYYDLGLAYDTARGASAYVSYRGGGWNDAHFDLSSFLKRRRGNIVNCTDCAALVETFSEMVGADMSYTTIQANYQLNYTRLIGYDEFSACPFGPGRCGFSYHAVTTPDNASTIYDATVALDGDDDPTTSPSTELMVHAIPGDEYIYRLVYSGNAVYRYTQKGTFQ